MPPASVTIRTGTSATFNATFSGTAPVDIQWKRGTLVVASSTFTGAGPGTEIVAEVASFGTALTTGANDGDQYVVVATNAAGTTTSPPAVLTVVSQRLFVTDGSSLQLWNNPHSLSTSRPADLSIALAGARAVATSGSQLFVLTNAGIVVWSDALGLTALTAPSFTIPLSALTPAPTQPLTRLTATTIGLFAWSQEGAWLLPAPLAASTTATAAFKHMWMQQPSLVHVPAPGGVDRLFMGQISGAGLLAWNGPGLATGQPMHDFATPNANIWALTLSNTRLIGGGSFGAGTPSVGIGLWNTPTAFSMARAPDVMLASTAGTFSSNDFVADLTCERDRGLLAAAIQNLSNQRLLVWENLATAGAASAPTFSGALPSSPRRVFSLETRHYVLTQSEVVVFETPLSGSTLRTVATLNGAAFTDFAFSR